MTDGRRFPGAGPVRLTGEGLLLREWRPGDAPRMSRLFDDPEVSRWTPLASPFDLAAATLYLERAAMRRTDGSALQLAIEEDGVGRPLGEVLLFGMPRVAEVGWSVGAPYRGRGVASRAVRVFLGWAGPAFGIAEFRALIEPGNEASERVARASGFARVDGPLIEVPGRDRRVALAPWRRDGVRPGPEFGIE